jgi:phosphotriesterase-related protein
LEAVVSAHLQTNAPIITHCEEGRLGDQQIARFQAHGVDLTRVVLSHTDKVLDRGYHRSMLDSGVNLEYDQALRHFDDPNQPTAALLADMIEAGFSAQLMLGTDGARRSLWRTLGGQPGLAYLGGEYQQLLDRKGIGPENLKQIMEENPARWLGFIA